MTDNISDISDRFLFCEVTTQVTSLGMDVLEALRSRRTVRQYDPDYAIPKEILDQLIAIGLDAPTARDAQGVDLLVVTNRAKIDEATKIVFDSWPQEKQDGWSQRKETYGVKNVVSCDAPCLICFVDNGNGVPLFLQIDTGIMTMAIMAACREFDLHSMCIGAVLWGDKAALERSLGIAEGKLLMVLAIGKSRGELVLKEKERKCKVSYIQ